MTIRSEEGSRAFGSDSDYQSVRIWANVTSATAALVIASIGGWLVLNGVSCWGGHPEDQFQVRLCEYSYLIPVIPAAVNFIALMVLNLAIRAFGQPLGGGVLARPRSLVGIVLGWDDFPDPSETRFLPPGPPPPPEVPRNLWEWIKWLRYGAIMRRQAQIMFAFEMFLWAYLWEMATWNFYVYEGSIPLGILWVFGMLRIALGLVVRLALFIPRRRCTVIARRTDQAPSPRAARRDPARSSGWSASDCD